MGQRSRVGIRTSGMVLVAIVTLIGGACSKAASPSPGASAAGGDSAASSAETAASRAPIRVVFVGTSLTAGLGLDPDSAYPARIQRKADSAGLSVTVVNAGVSGETSAGALRRIDWVLREPADLVVLETGANDGLRALRVDSTRANIEGIVRRIRSALPSARVLLVQMEAPTNLGPRYTTEFRAMFPSVAAAEGIAVAPFLLANVAGIARLNQPDGVHPNDAGERLVAENVWRAVAPLLQEMATQRASRSAGTG